VNGGAKKPSILFENHFLKVLASAERNRAISALGLSARALNSLDRARIRSIGQLVRAARKGIAPPRASGRKTAADIQNALHVLSSSVRANGVIDWTAYVDARALESVGSQETLPKPNRVGAAVIQVRNLALDSLMPACHGSRLEILHLSFRACTSLRRIQINTLGELVDSAGAGITRLPAAGDATIGEINSALHALSRSIENDGTVDWMNYAAECGFSILPKREYSALSPTRFLKILPEVMSEAVESRYGASGSFVLRNYLLQGARRTKSFARLAQKSGCTKQGVALNKRRVVRMLSEAVLNDSYGGCRFRFRQSFVARFRQLDAALRIAQTRPLLYSEWQESVGQLWRIAPTQIESLESFFFDILGYHIVHRSNSHFQRILLPRSKNTLPFTIGSSAAEQLLRYHFPNGLSREQLIAELEKSAKIRLTKSEIPAIIGSIPGVEQVKSQNRFQVRLGDVVRVSDQLERILRTRGAPMHLRELTSEIRRVARKHGRLRTPRHISSSLNYDKRFKAISRTGYWVLSEWKDFETRTAAGIAAEILRMSGKPMTEAQLYHFIVERRPVSRRSIGTLLRQDGRFFRVAPCTWQLKSRQD
jgi:hypothetical protein